jgi:acetolactate synthase-1/3 small subunit
MVEISGEEKKIEAFIEAVRPYGIRELARTGRIALVRSAGPGRSGERDRAEPTTGEPAPAVMGHSSL